MNLIEQIRENQKELQKLKDQGVISVDNIGAAHLTIELFMKLSNGDYKINKVEDSAYPYWIEAEIDGLEIFAILTEREMDELKGGLDG